MSLLLWSLKKCMQPDVNSVRKKLNFKILQQVLQLPHWFRRWSYFHLTQTPIHVVPGTLYLRSTAGCSWSHSVTSS